MEDKFLHTLQKKTLETLKFSIDFFESHNLKYVACGGTCLGAIRHHGMIPWDDDVDLFMPYEDYQKLLSLKKEIDASGKFILLTPETQGYYDPVSRISCTDISIWRYYLNPIIFGTQIDIFPIYNTNLSDNEISIAQKKLFKLTYKYQRANQKYGMANFIECIKNKHLRGLLKTIKWSLSTKNVEKYRKDYLDFEKTLHEPNGKRCTIYGAFAYGVEIYKAGWFDESIIVPFSDFSIRVPKVYDAYLKRLYKDYMQLPPEDQRHSKHGDYYINFKEGLTINEVRLRMKKGEKYVL